MRYVAGRAPGPLKGSVAVPGDKSISHRAVLFAAMAEGTSHLSGVLDSADVRSTIAAVQALGARATVERGVDGGLELTVTGWGAAGPASPPTPVDCGNSGTTARLLLGVLAGYEDVTATLVGDESLSRRPMRRVAEPLSAMGARFESRDGALPVTVHGARLRPREHVLRIASAQVKTALLVAGTRAEGRTVVAEPAASRDHTERMLPGFGVDVGRDTDTCSAWVDGPVQMQAADVAVPADPSSAAFMVAAAVIVPGSDARVRGIALNPTRSGFLRVLSRMGARIDIEYMEPVGEETVGDIRARHCGHLHGVTVGETEMPSLVDEVPVLAIVAAHAEGTTRFEGASELRVKESDRLGAIEAALSTLGCTVRSGDDWLEVDGPCQLAGGELDSLGDHRLAMSYAVAALTASGPVAIEGFEAVGVSYPRFLDDLAALGAHPYE